MREIMYKVVNRLSRMGLLNWIPDKMYLNILYKIKFRKKINFNNPITFNEKLQWLKLYDKKDIYTTMVDKYEAKKYVANIIGDKYIIPTLGIYDKWEEIDFDKLPNQFVIKCTHDSGGLVICKDKTVFNYNDAERRIKKSLKNNYFYVAREWPYKNVKPRIIIEKYMEEKSEDNTINKSMTDYKFFCFKGEPKLMYISTGLENHETASMSFLDMNYNLTDCKRTDFKLLNYVPSKPSNFEKMKEFSKILSKNIPHIRVDWYEINGELFFGELTFYTCGGFLPFDDEKWNVKLGNWIEFPK